MSAFDLVIRGGTLVDGQGGPPRPADVGITGGIVADVGHGLGRGRREVSADGAIVTLAHRLYQGRAALIRRAMALI